MRSLCLATFLALLLAPSLGSAQPVTSCEDDCLPFAVYQFWPCICVDDDGDT